MKKISLFLILSIFFVLTGCNTTEKEVGSLSNFETNASNNDFTVVDNMNNYQGLSYINSAMLASKDETKIEMIIYDTEKTAINVQEKQIESFMNLKNTLATVSKEKGKNYYKFTMISNGYFMVSSRIANTLIFTKSPIDEKNNIENILNEMGY